MNKYQLYTLSGTLLAATSLAGMAHAATQGVGSVASGTFTSGAIKVSTTVFSPTAATAASQTIGGGGAGIAISFLNSYDDGFTLNVTVPISGATFNATPTVKYIVRDHAVTYTSGTYLAVATAASLGATAPTVTSISNTLFINSLAIGSVNTVNSAQIGGIVLSSVVFAQASGLASGGSVALGATVQNTSGSTTYETIANTAILTGVAPLTTVVTAGTNGVVNASSSPTLFTNFSSGGGSSGLTLTLASVAITSTGATGTDLATVLSSDGSTTGAAASGSAILTISSAALSDPAAGSLYVLSGATAQADATAGSATSLSTSQFSSGSVTFTITAAAGNNYDRSLTVNLIYSGATAISAAAAGTASIAYTTGGESLVAPASASGSTAVVTRGGLSAEVNYASNGLGANGFFSFIRIHNKGTTAATASITVKNDATGAQVGTTTYTTASVPAGGTIQVSTGDIEKGLSVTPTANTSYTLSVSGAFPGYVQHITYNPTSGAFGELDGYRSSGVTNP
jgi:hypothetical protein